MTKRLLSLVAGAALTLVAAGEAAAQRTIGQAVTINREVSGLLAGSDRRLSSGDNVFADETIRTAAESAARLRFLDATTLAVGPSASVRLDRFVFNPDSSARTLAVTVGRGAFRWTSGQSAPRAYEVKTPQAVIGIRGTSFDLVVESGREILTLREGVIRACVIASGRCLVLDIPGQVVVIAGGAITRRSDRAEAPQRFADRCLSGAGPACTTAIPVDTADTPPPVRGGWTGFHLGLHADGVRGGGGPRYDGSPSVAASIALGNVPARASFEDLFVRVGLGGGYSLQQGPIVYGLDVDVSFLGGTTRSREQRVFGAAAPIVVTTETRARLDYLATLRPRIGTLLRDDLLVYVTGGLALGGLDIAGGITNTTGGGGIYAGRGSAVRAGWVAGIGAETLLLPGVTLRAEYLHYALASATVRFAETTGFAPPGDPTPFARSRVKAAGDVLRISLNRRF